MADAKAKTKNPAEPTTVKQLNEKAQLCAVRFSPCGKQLAAGTTTGQVLRWDASTDDFAELPTFTGHGGFVQGLIFGPNHRLYSADSWGRLCAWNYLDEQPTPTWNLPQAHAGWLRELAVTPDGQTLLSCGRDQFVRLWETATGKLQAELPDHQRDVFCMAIAPDGAHFATGDLAGKVLLWETATRKVVTQFDAKKLAKFDRLQDVGGARWLRFANEGKQLYVGGTQPKNGGNVQGTPTVLVFNVATGKQERLIDLGSTYVYVCDWQFLPEGGHVLALSGNPGSGKFALYSVGADKPSYENTKFGNCHAIDLHPAGRRLAVVGVNSNTAGNGRLKGKDGAMDYPSNWSPIHILDLPAAS